MNEAVAEIDNVSKVFDGKIHALNNINLKINRNDFLVIAGSNGSGKSVLMTLIAGLDNPSKGKISTSGKVGLVFQDADSQILGESPLDDVLFGIKNCGVPKKDQVPLAENVLERVGLLHKKNDGAAALSGGEKRRLAVAGILAMNRDIILFDEPFANLDWPGVKSVCSILSDLKSRGVTVVVLTHETEKILGLANRFVILDKGEIRFDGTVREGLSLDLEKWSIRNPMVEYKKIGDLLWL